MATVPNANKIAIFLKSTPKPEELVATASVYSYYKAQNKKVVVISQNKEIGSKLKALVSELEIKTSLPPKQYIINYKKDGTEVQQVQWQQDQEGLNIYLTLAKGTIDLKDLKLQKLGADYEVAILPGISELSQLGELYKQNESFFKDVKLFSIGTELNLGDSYQHTSSNKPNLDTLSEQVFHALDYGNIEKNTAQLLLSGIMLETANLTKPVKNPEIFDTMKKLVQKKADTAETETTKSKLKSGGDGQGAGGSEGDSKGKKPSETTSKTSKDSEGASKNSNSQPQSAGSKGSQVDDE